MKLYLIILIEIFVCQILFPFTAITQIQIDSLTQKTIELNRKILQIRSSEVQEKLPQGTDKHKIVFHQDSLPKKISNSNISYSLYNSNIQLILNQISNKERIIKGRSDLNLFIAFVNSLYLAESNIYLEYYSKNLYNAPKQALDNSFNDTTANHLGHLQQKTTNINKNLTDFRKNLEDSTEKVIKNIEAILQEGKIQSSYLKELICMQYEAINAIKGIKGGGLSPINLTPIINKLDTLDTKLNQIKLSIDPLLIKKLDSIHSQLRLKILRDIDSVANELNKKLDSIHREIKLLTEKKDVSIKWQLGGLALPQERLGLRVCWAYQTKATVSVSGIFPNPNVKTFTWELMLGSFIKNFHIEAGPVFYHISGFKGSGAVRLSTFLSAGKKTTKVKLVPNISYSPAYGVGIGVGVGF
jgi:hypothetical protein